MKARRYERKKERKGRRKEERKRVILHQSYPYYVALAHFSLISSLSMIASNLTFLPSSFPPPFSFSCVWQSRAKIYPLMGMKYVVFSRLFFSVFLSLCHLFCPSMFEFHNALLILILIFVGNQGQRCIHLWR